MSDDLEIQENRRKKRTEELASWEVWERRKRIIRAEGAVERLRSVFRDTAPERLSDAIHAIVAESAAEDRSSIQDILDTQAMVLTVLARGGIDPTTRETVHLTHRTGDSILSLVYDPVTHTLTLTDTDSTTGRTEYHITLDTASSRQEPGGAAILRRWSGESSPIG